MKAYRKLYDAEKFDTVREYINNGIKKYPNNNAFILKHKNGKEVSYTNITYTKFGEDIKAFGTALIHHNLENKRIAIIGKNRYEWAIAFVSILCGVGITVPLDKGLPEQEIILSLERAKADAIVFESEYSSIMENVQKSNSRITTYICMDSNCDGKFKTVADFINEGAELLKAGNTNYDNHKIDPDSIASIIFTSGTTSMSKAVMLSNKNIASNIYNINLAEKIYDTDVNMAFLPLHHTFGSTALLLFLADGVTNVFCDGLRHIQENLREYKVSIFVCVPLLLEAMYKKIYAEVDKQGKTKLLKFANGISRFLLKFKIDIRRKVFKQILDNLGGRIRFVISGASAIDKNVARGFYDFGILAVQGYGLTETSPVLSAENAKCIKFGSVGLPLPEVEIKIDNPNEEGIGEIVAKGPNVMLGYYEMEEETAKVLKDGWFYTGDLGYIDKDGFLFITGRKKNVIVLKNGKNVYPEEIELLISTLPYVSENMVYGTPKEDDLVLSAKIVYNKDYIKEKYGDISESDLKDIVWKDIKKINSGLPNYKHIKNLIITDEPMVKTTTQKVKRFEEIKKL